MLINNNYVIKFIDCPGGHDVIFDACSVCYVLYIRGGRVVQRGEEKTKYKNPLVKPLEQTRICILLLFIHICTRRYIKCNII